MSTKYLCVTCDNENPLFICSRCQTSRYCSRKCQMRNWLEHESNCVAVVSLATSASRRRRSSRQGIQEDVESMDDAQARQAYQQNIENLMTGMAVYENADAKRRSSSSTASGAGGKSTLSLQSLLAAADQQMSSAPPVPPRLSDSHKLAHSLPTHLSSPLAGGDSAKNGEKQMPMVPPRVSDARQIVARAVSSSEADFLCRLVSPNASPHTSHGESDGRIDVKRTAAIQQLVSATQAASNRRSFGPMSPAKVRAALAMQVEAAKREADAGVFDMDTDSDGLGGGEEEQSDCELCAAEEAGLVAEGASAKQKKRQLMGLQAMSMQEMKASRNLCVHRTPVREEEEEEAEEDVALVLSDSDEEIGECEDEIAPLFQMRFFDEEVEEEEEEDEDAAEAEDVTEDALAGLNVRKLEKSASENVTSPQVSNDLPLQKASSTGDVASPPAALSPPVALRLDQTGSGPKLDKEHLAEYQRTMHTVDMSDAPKKRGRRRQASVKDKKKNRRSLLVGLSHKLSFKSISPPLTTAEKRKQLVESAALPALVALAEEAKPASDDPTEGLGKESKSVFGAWLLKYNNKPIPLSTKIMDDKHCNWLIGWVKSTKADDRLVSQAARCLCSLAYPHELVPGLQQLITSRKAVRPLLLLAQRGVVIVHKEVPAGDVTMGEVIARGGEGIIRLGNYALKGREQVVMKVCSEEHISFDIENFRLEAALLSILNHDNVLGCYGASFAGPEYFMILPYMQRGSLDKVLADTSLELDLLLKVKLATKIAKGMAYLHQGDVMHRDLKSANILVGANWDVKIIDFGSSVVLMKGQTLEKNKGTTAWMAPEVFHSEQYNKSADVYSFGIILWEIMTRRNMPYEGVCKIFDVPEEVMAGARPILPTKEEGCPKSIIHLIQQCWHGNPDSRPSFTEICKKLYDAYKKIYLRGASRSLFGSS